MTDLEKSLAVIETVANIQSAMIEAIAKYIAKLKGIVEMTDDDKKYLEEIRAMIRQSVEESQKNRKKLAEILDTESKHEG